jgi:hypothetical protein
MNEAKIIIKDEVNAKLEGLEVGDRRALMKMFEYEMPGARYLPAVRLGRWNGKISYFSLAGSTYVNLLDRIIPYLYDKGYAVELQDMRQTHAELKFEQVTGDTFSHICWPKGHEREGQPVVLRDYQIEIINNFLANPQSLQEIATGAGKCVAGDTLLALDIDENAPFGKFLLNKLRQEQENDVTRDNKKL